MIGYVYPDETQFIVADVILTPREHRLPGGRRQGLLDVSMDSLTLGAGVFHPGDWLGIGRQRHLCQRRRRNTSSRTPSCRPASPSLARSAATSSARVDAYLGGFELIDYTYWNAGVSYTWKNFTLDLRYHDTDLSKDECFINTTDPNGIFTGSGRSKWCGEAFVATLSVDITASQLGIFAPAR